MSSRGKNSRARLTIELAGPTDQVQDSILALVQVGKSKPDVLFSFPEPVIVQPLVRPRRKAAKGGE